MLRAHVFDEITVAAVAGCGRGPVLLLLAFLDGLLIVSLLCFVGLGTDVAVVAVAGA